MLRAGDFFTGPYPPNSGKKRRFIVLTDEVEDVCVVVWVYLSTTCNDASCVFLKGEHPEITEECVVVYEEATIASAAKVQQAVDDGALTRCDPLDESLVQRAFDALFASEETPGKVLDYCADLD